MTIDSIAGNPSWVSLAGGVITAAAPSGTGPGTYQSTALIKDPGGLTATATINLTITNQPPTAVADAYYTAAGSLPFDPTLNDTDPEHGPLTVQTVTVIDGPATVISVNGNLVTVSLGHGVSDFSYTIADSGGLTSSSTITITSNQPPTIPDVTGSNDSQPTLDVYLEPSDPDGDAVTVTRCDAPPDLFTVEISSEPDVGEPNRVKLHITVLNPVASTVIFNCFAVDTFGAVGSGQVNLTITP